MSEPEPTALATLPDGEIVEAAQTAVTPAQAKTDAIAALTMQAYARASELKLTPDEDKALAEDFPDEAFRPGANGNEQLIYIEHAFLRDRFNQVLGRGQWSLVVRSKWTEPYKTSTGKDAVRVYSEVMLMVRGCFVAEATGEMDYFLNNAKQTYADAIEGSKTAAFRRLAKDFGVGLQAWKKGWTAGWWERQRNPRQAPSSPAKASGPAKPTDTPTEPSAAVVKILESAAKGGMESLQAAWKLLTNPQKKSVQEIMKKLKEDAYQRDKMLDGLGDANEDGGFSGGPEPE